jgi:hypothetical protein
MVLAGKLNFQILHSTTPQDVVASAEKKSFLFCQDKRFHAKGCCLKKNAGEWGLIITQKCPCNIRLCDFMLSVYATRPCVVKAAQI